ncbi:multiple sugar transport system permease protein [Lachnospiraceae bacterium KH1T2]|nr:multiple sugar transport system permease protein [Lachnospiraceae bacterium KH1T2]
MKRTKQKKNNFSYARYGYLFSLPFALSYAIFSLYPTLYTAIIGFTDLKGIGKTDFHFLWNDPFQNFRTVLTSPTFQTAFKNTIVLWVSNFIPQMALALLLAAWFTDRRTKVPGKGLFKVVFYMPNIITAATVAILFNALFGHPMGPVNDLLVRFGILKEPFNFLIKKGAAKGIVIFIQTWMWYGYTMIVLISGILGISPDIFEAAEVDGANGWQIFWKITLPNIRTILLFTLVTSLIGGLNMFDIPKLFLLGGPDNATMTTSVFIYNQAFSGAYLYNRAAAASMIMFVIIVSASALLFWLMRDRDEEALKKQKKRKNVVNKKVEEEEDTYETQFIH